MESIVLPVEILSCLMLRSHAIGQPASRLTFEPQARAKSELASNGSGGEESGVEASPLARVCSPTVSLLAG